MVGGWRSSSASRTASSAARSASEKRPFWARAKDSTPPIAASSTRSPARRICSRLRVAYSMPFNGSPCRQATRATRFVGPAV